MKVIEGSKANIVRTKPNSLAFVAKVDGFAVLFYSSSYDVTLFADRAN